MIAVTDPFMANVPTRRPGDFERTVKGVPLVADPNGTLTKPKNKKDPGHVKRVMYRRPSGFGKQIENTYNLQKWGERQEALGFALDFNLLKRAAALLDGGRDSKTWKDEADQVVVAAKQAAKAWIAADRGTHSHGLAEDDDEGRDIIGRIEHGETLGLDRDVQRALVAEWRAMLERNGLEILAVEFACVNDHYKAAGTGDRIARLTRPLRFRLCAGELVTLPNGTIVVLDLKTGQRRLDNAGVVMYWQSYAVQVAIYAGGCLYDPETDTRSPYPWPVDQDWALIAHLDVLGAMDGRPSCELVLVDLRAGRAAADLCVAARAWENETTVFSVAQLDVEGEGCHYSGETPSTHPVAGPVVPPATPIAGEVEGAACTPSPALTVDPARLAIVDARATLKTEPSQGADLSDEEAFGPLWTKVRDEYQALDAASRSWIAELSSKATRQGLSFHTVNCRTERSYEIARGLVALATAEADNDEMLRALLVLVIGDVALFAGVAPGHALGSLNHLEAKQWADYVDTFNGPGLAAWIDHDGTFRLRELSPA